MELKDTATFADFDNFMALDIRIGTVIAATINAKATKPAYILTLDFGEFGIKKSSAQLTQLYDLEDLIGKQIVAVVNFKPRQVAAVMSECLVLGCYNENNDVVLLNVERKVANGSKIA